MKRVLVISIILCMPLFMFAQQYKIPIGVFGSGGSSASNSLYSINSTAGQSAIGKGGNSSFSQSIGFWYAQTNIVTDVEEDVLSIPTEYRLEQNYPNPFNPSTIINYQLPVSSYVSLIVYDILGRKVAELINSQWKEAGYHQFNFSAVSYNLSSGIYFYRIQTDGYSDVKKFVVLK